MSLFYKKNQILATESLVASKNINRAQNLLWSSTVIFNDLKQSSNRRIEPVKKDNFSLKNNQEDYLNTQLASFLQKEELNLILKDKKVFYIKQKTEARLTARPTIRNCERETGFEPATFSLARKRSTTELLPRHWDKTIFFPNNFPILSASACESSSKLPRKQT